MSVKGRLLAGSHANRNYRVIERMEVEEEEDGFSVLHSVVEVSKLP